MLKLKAFILFCNLILVSACTSEKVSEKTNSSTDLPGHKPIEASKAWEGNWEREDWGSNAKLEVFDVIGDSIHFDIMAFNGANEGGLVEAAVVVDNKAVYHFKDSDDECLIEFTLQGDSVIMVDQKEGICFAGYGVNYSGKYRNTKLIAAHPKKPESLLSLGIFHSQVQDSTFRALVGDNYDLFLNSTQLTMDTDDLDQFNAEVTASGIRGLFTFMENIIMIDSENHIWAAVIDDEKTVLYFTNNAKDVATLPKTIDAWRENFKDYNVIYKSK